MQNHPAATRFLRLLAATATRSRLSCRFLPGVQGSSTSLYSSTALHHKAATRCPTVFSPQEVRRLHTSGFQHCAVAARIDPIEADDSANADSGAGPPGGDAAAPLPPGAVENFQISAERAELLREKGISTLFPIQSETFNLILAGKDLIARSRTGTGKTLAFALPLVEKICAEKARVRAKAAYGRLPVLLVMAPTRELAKQVAKEFEWVATDLKVTTIYGGAPYTIQEEALARGTDVVVGTPGRIIDLMDKGALDLSAIKYSVLDEADEMLKIGFAEALDRILSSIPSEGRQTLLFSATVPAWVRGAASKYMNNPETIDTIGTHALKTSETVRHVAIRVHAASRAQILGDVITTYAPERAIVFTKTKSEADELYNGSFIRSVECGVLHGDISQAQREKTLARFRAGKVNILVATDVAARGLDIPEVDLVVQYTVPEDIESYVHRSGRTGRAGRDGVSIVLYTEYDRQAVYAVGRATGVKFELRGPPDPTEVMTSSAERAVDLIERVHPDVIPHFLPTATRLLSDPDKGAALLAAALAHVAKVTRPPVKRSLLTAIEGRTALLLRGARTVPEAINVTKSLIPNELAPYITENTVGKVALCSEGAIVDVADAIAEAIMKEAPSAKIPRRLSVEVPDALPALNIEVESRRGSDRSLRGRDSSPLARASRSLGYQSGRSSSRRGSSSPPHHARTKRPTRSY